MEQTTQKIYNISQFAQLLQISVPTLRRWDRDKKLPAYRSPSNGRFYTHQQYVDYLRHSRMSFTVVETLDEVKQNHPVRP